MRRRVVVEMAWLLLKPVMKTKNKKQNRKNNCIKAKEGREEEGKGESLKELIEEEKLKRGQSSLSRACSYH
jgi:hypothetical protein